MIRSQKKRSGFTLVELMIAATITVIIMTILSICFQTSMKAMSAMRAQGDAADQLRAVGEVIKRDLDASQASQSLPIDTDPNAATVRNRGRRPSDYFSFQRATFQQIVTPRSGFFLLDSPPSTTEGNDGVFESSRNVGCRIWKTCVLAGGTEGNLFTATSGGVAFSSEAAEVAYFLVPMNELATPTGLTRYNLHRRQRLVAVDAAKQSSLPAGDPEVISTYQFTVSGMPNAPTSFTWTRPNTMTSLAYGETLYPPNNNPVFTGPTRSMTIGSSILSPIAGTRAGSGDDVILSNVISFEIKPTWIHTPPINAPNPPPPIINPRAYAAPNVTDAPFDTLLNFPPSAGYPGYRFDSMMPNALYPSMRINALQVRLRIYDPKAKTARQSTYVFEQ